MLNPRRGNRPSYKGSPPRKRYGRRRPRSFRGRWLVRDLGLVVLLFTTFSLGKWLGTSAEVAIGALVVAAVVWCMWLYGGLPDLRRNWPRSRTAAGNSPPWKLAAALFVAVFVVGLGVLQWRGAERQAAPQSLFTAPIEAWAAEMPQHADRPAAPRTQMTPIQSTRTFGLCHTGGGQNCVVDGDTFWIDGMKIRVADIDAPETHPPRCPYEADVGDRATGAGRGADGAVAAHGLPPTQWRLMRSATQIKNLKNSRFAREDNPESARILGQKKRGTLL
jgi:hypothetical protein